MHDLGLTLRGIPHTPFSIDDSFHVRILLQTKVDEIGITNSPEQYTQDGESQI